jgi:hypothetical protein
MARSLFRSYWAAIRPQCLSQLGKTNFILCIYQTAIYTTTLVAHTWKELAFLHSFRFPRVSTTKTILILCLQYLLCTKADRKYQGDDKFRTFRRQLFHFSLSAILEPLRPAMTTPELTLCPDGHFRRVIYGLGPYIADYPEQALLACVVQGWCPK